MHDRMTKGDIEKMQAEIDERKLVERPKILEELKEAKAQGDLSENFEYHEAKRARNLNDSRIRYLERMIRTAVIVDETAAADDEVGMDKPVTVYFPEDDEEETFRIVTSIRGNSLENLISIESPMGKALLHHHVGETVTVRPDSGVSYDVVIRKVGKMEDASGDRIKTY